ncbi:AP-3 complex subunit mu-1 isoform X2 [Mixophyes fleayi]|uniref:AP-3 complex subunit mu-1 isoform X2 n=1 Tax=Mixophyes fleayi TaxID=3061075 RepID=UPI003F4DCAB9
MIHSLFLVNGSGDIFLEKHWKSVVSRSVCDYFFEAQEKALDVENVPPVIPTPHHYLISIYREKMFFVAVIQSEVTPLFVIEFLHRVADTFQDYFGESSETCLKDNVVIVYELLEEMLDNGFPLATESNILKELIKPPTILRSVVNSLTGSSNMGETLPTGQLSNIPWRRAGVKYTNNEAYFDVIEEVDAIIDKSGSTVFAEIQGVVEACVKLSGMPDLTLSFMNPRLLDDVSFHPCVRFKRWESERVLSFIPPDGNFRLMSYRVSSQNLVAIPVYLKHNITFQENSSSGRFDVTVGPKQNMGKIVESVVLTVNMPKVVLNMNLTPTQGTYMFDPVTKINN